MIVKDKELKKQLKKLMIPIVFQTLMMNAVSFGDTFMLGFVDQNSLAAVSLASQVTFILNLFSWALTGGATVLSAQYMGKGDTDTVRRVFGLILRWSMMISAVFFSASFFAPELLMRAFTNSPEMIAIGADYLRITSFSYLFVGIGQSYLCMLKICDRAKAGSVITIGVVILDLFLNAVFIFGLFGSPAMGAKGAALTTSVSKFLEMAVVVAFAFGSKMLRPKAIFKVKFSLEKEFWKFAFPILINSMLWGGGITLYSVIVGHLGNDATAAYSIVNVIKNLLISIGSGLGSATGIILGNAFGENKFEVGKRYGGQLSRFSVLLGLITAAFAVLIGPLFILLFKTNEQTNAYLVWMIAFCALNCLGRCINDTVIVGVFYSGGETRFDAVSLAVTMWGIILPIALCAAFWWKISVTFVYLIIASDEIIKLPWVYSHYKKYRWVRNITKENI